MTPLSRPCKTTRLMRGTQLAGLSSVLLAWTSICPANPLDQFTEQQISRMPSSAQKFVKLNRHLVRDQGYEGIRTVGFNAGANSSVTSIVKRKNDPAQPIYSAVVIKLQGAPEVYFKNFVDCVPGQDRKMLERTLRIDDQPFPARYFCAKGEPGDSTNTEVYQLASEAGKDFARQAFANNMFVFVNFTGSEIPFITTDFADTWSKVSASAP